MWALLDKVRQQPPAARQQYAFWAAALITGIITLGWLASVTVTVQDTAATLESRQEELGDQPGVWAQFFDQTRDRAEQLMQSVRSQGDTSNPTEPAVTATSSPATTTTPTTDPAPVGRPIQIATTSETSTPE
jgi:hypothetical protein